MVSERRLLVVSIVAVLVVIGLFTAHTVLSPNPPDWSPPVYNNVDFDGHVEGNDSFSMNGTLQLEGFNQKQTSFDNISLRLYDENGSLLFGDCLGTLSENKSIEISIMRPGSPEYVIFASPDFQTRETVEHFTINYYYRQNDDYLVGAWARPSDLPIDVTEHAPCG